MSTIQTPDQLLRQAASAGSLAAVEGALAIGANVNARGDYGDAALNLAAEYGHIEVVERLLAAARVYELAVARGLGQMIPLFD